MLFEQVQCANCGQANQIAQESSRFFCAACGAECSIEYEYVYMPPKDAPPAPATTSSEDADRRLKRAFLFLEDGEFLRAWSYGESVLDYDPENAEAYLVELLAVLHLHEVDDLSSCELDLSAYRLFNRALQFADNELHRQLRGYVMEKAQQ